MLLRHGRERGSQSDRAYALVARTDGRELEVRHVSERKVDQRLRQLGPLPHGFRCPDPLRSHSARSQSHTQRGEVKQHALSAAARLVHMCE